MSEPIVSYFSKEYFLRTYFNSHGRLSRANFFAAFLILACLYFVTLFLLSFIGLFFTASGFAVLSDLTYFIPTFFAGYGLAIILIKRLHDVALSGWWSVGALVPLIGTMPMVLMAFLLKGTTGDNRYGPETAL